MPEQSPPQLPENLYAIVAYVHGECNRDLLEAIADSELTFSQLHLLIYLARAPIAPTVKRAAYVLRMRPQSLSRAVDGLRDRGMVDRETDRRDARARRLTITPRGRAQVQALSAARLDAIRDFCNGLDPEQRYELEQLASRASTRPEVARLRPA